MVKCTYAGKISIVKPAEGTTGFLILSNGRIPIFRVYNEDKSFTDYRIMHDDLEITITN